MPTHPTSTAHLYNDELIQAHREALAALRDLLASEGDPVERRRLAVAILRARPVEEDPADDTPPGRTHSQPEAADRHAADPDGNHDAAPPPHRRHAAAPHPAATGRQSDPDQWPPSPNPSPLINSSQPPPITT